MKPQIDCVSSSLEERLFPTSFHKLFHAACQDLQGSQPEKEYCREQKNQGRNIAKQASGNTSGDNQAEPVKPLAV